MALTRPTLNQINTTITALNDPLTVINKSATSANQDVGFVFNRDGGSTANVAVIWDETNDQFALVTTSSSGATNANVTISDYADVRVGSAFVDDVLRIAQNASGLRMTNVGAFDNDGSDNFRIFSTNDLILAANGESGTAITIDATNQDVTITNDLRVTAGQFYYGGTAVTATATELNHLDGVTGITLGTANELLIVGSDGSSIESDGTLTIDPGNNYVGINQTSPEVTLHMTGEGAQTAQIRMEQYNDSADAPDVRTRRYRGTIASPSAVQSGDYLFRSNHEYYNGTSLLVGGAFAFDNTNNANRTQFSVAVDIDGTGADPQGNNGQFKIDGNDSGAITFNNAYKFPTADGSANNILATDGSGALTFTGDPTFTTVTTTGNVTVSGDLDIDDADSVFVHGDAGYVNKRYVLYGTTTDATTTEIFVGGTANSRVAVANNTTMFYTVDIVARRTDATGESAGWQLKGVADNFSGTTADVGDVYEVAVARDDANWEVDALAGDTEDAIVVTVTGAASKTVKWMAVVKTMEIAN